MMNETSSHEDKYNSEVVAKAYASAKAGMKRAGVTGDPTPAAVALIKTIPIEDAIRSTLDDDGSLAIGVFSVAETIAARGTGHEG